MGDQRNESGELIVGRNVHKKFKGFGVFTGKIISYNTTRGFYKIRYEDGDVEELEFEEVMEILMPEENEDRKRKNEGSPQKRRGRKRKRRKVEVQKVEKSGDPKPAYTGKRRGRKRKLPGAPKPEPVRRSLRQAAVVKEAGEVSPRVTPVVRVTVDGKVVRGRGRPRKLVAKPLLPLPPSSGDLCVPEESVPSLFYVYNTLRSFSKLLFLSPFGLEDFVSALNYRKANSLVDSVHLALLQTLKRHLEFIAPDEGPAAAVAIRCLRHLDWNFLDRITWPVYLVEYLSSQGFSKISHQKLGHMRLCNSEYYMTPVSMKLTILEFLCNEVMETEEISTEIGIRLKFEGHEESNEVDDLNGSSDPLVEKKSRRGRKRILRRHCKESVKLNCTKTDDQESSISSQMAGGKTSQTQSKANFQGNSSCTQNSEYEIARSEANDVENWNIDECCLCSMEGTLICCDGCPAAYHSRCVGVSKDSLPEGEWYCPECLVTKGPKGFAALKGLQGANLLGIDSHGRVYFSICGYLLVFDSVVDPDATYKYYNRIDSRKVLEILDSSTPLYESVRNAIVKSLDMLIKDNHGEKNKISTMDPSCLNKADNFFEKCPSEELSMISVSQSLIQQEQENASLLPAVTYQENAIPRSGPILDGRSVQHFGAQGHKEDFEMMVMDQSNDATQLASSGSSLEMTSLNADAQGFKNNYEQQFIEPNAPCDEYTRNMPLQDGQVTEVDAGSSAFQVEQQPEESDIGTLCIPGQMDSFTKPPNKELAFQLNAYVNHYVFGDVAASAAANLAVKAAENKTTMNVQRSSKRSPSAAITEQMKAFSEAAVKFCWPCFSNKLVEVQKEKCGWCLNCKSSTNDRDCLLHMASENAKAGASGKAGGISPTKNGDDHFPAILAYLLYLEDELHCLLDGPWENLSYREYWRKYVKQASSIAEIKYSLLELELNIKPIALSADWYKPVDDAFAEAFASQVSASVAVLTPKRGRPRKHSAAVKLNSTPAEARTFGVNWWRGGRLSRQAFYRNFIPRVIAWKAGREAGLRKIPGIIYSEGLEMPRRTKRYAWRAAVEMARDVSQIAFQIRILDACIRWDDIVSSEDSPQSKRAEGKGSAGYKKAIICAKNSEKGLVKYLLDFKNQKAIPTSIVKHGTKLQDGVEGRNKYWISENYVPLYLLKKFQGKARSFTPPKKDSKEFYPLPSKLSKTSNLSGFSYLLAKATGCGKGFCAHCETDLYSWKAVQCDICQGYFHRKCMMASLIMDTFECKFRCYKCHYIKRFQRDSNTVKVHSEKNGVPTKSCDKLAEETELKGMSSLDRTHKKYKRRRSHAEIVAEHKHNSVTKHVCRPSEEHGDNGMSLRGEKRKKYSRHQLKGENIAEERDSSARNCICRLAEEPEENGMPSSSKKQKKYRRDQSNVAKEKHDSVRKPRVRKTKEAVRLDGLLWKSNGSNEVGKEFRQNKLFLPCQDNMNAFLGPRCFLCCEEYNSQLIYVGCESCTEWFHGDAFGLTMENVLDLIGFKCHKCRKRTRPGCPYDKNGRRKSPGLKNGTVNGELLGEAKNKKPLDVIYNRSRFVSTEEQPVMVVNEDLHVVTQIDLKFEYAPVLEENILNSASIPVYQDPIPPEMNGDFVKDYLQEGMTNWPQERKEDGWTETSIVSETKSNDIIQSFSGIQNPSMFSYTELLASEDDKIENLFDLSGDVHNWSVNSQPVEKSVNVSQLQGVLDVPNHTSGTRVSPIGSEKIESHIVNTFSLENFVHQRCSNGSNIMLEENKLEKCANCDLTVVPPDLRCSGCGIAIHCHCYDQAPTGLWTEHGWLCGACQSGFGQG